MQGYIASVWAMASLVGPTLGGDLLRLPVLALDLLRQPAARARPPPGCCGAGSTRRSSARRHRIDYAGARAARRRRHAAAARPARGRRAVGRGARRPASGSSSSAVVLLVAFVLVERTGGRAGAAAVGLPAAGCSTPPTPRSLVVGVLMLGLSSYVPLYAQAVLGHGARRGRTRAGGDDDRLADRRRARRAASTCTIGFRATMLMGAAFAVAGAPLLLTVGPRQLPAAPRPALLRDGRRLRLRRQPGRRRRADARSSGSTAAWPPAPTCSPARSAAPSASRSSARSPTSVVAARTGGTVPDLEHLPTGVLDPAIHAVFLASALVSLVLLGVGILMPRRLVEGATGP